MSTPTNEQREAEVRERLRRDRATGNAKILILPATLFDDLEWALSRIEELAKDKARLDWMSQLGEGSYMHKDLVDYWPNDGRDWAAFTEQARDDNDPASSHATLREAIDAAMQAQSDAEFDAENPRPYRCGAFGTTTGSQCVLESDHDGEHQLETPAASSSGANTP